MDNPQHIKQLYQKYLNNDYSEQELDELLEYFYASGDQHALSEMIKSELANEDADHKSHAVVQSLLSELDQELFVELQRRKKVSSPMKLWPRIAVAAAAVAAITLGVWLYYAPSSRQSAATRDLYTNDIAPGKIGATLTLANGKKIRLADAANGELAKEAGISVSKTADGQVVYEINPSSTINPSSRTEGRDLSDGKDLSRSFEMTKDVGMMNTLTTARGETYILTLPDKSKVWLNAASSLTYNAGLMERGVRKVRLAGEAYFEVAKDKAHPFIVESANQQVEVLGTHFNINSYADEPDIKTTLLEGSVRVANTPRHPELVLPPAASSRSGSRNSKAAVQVQDGERFSVVLKPGEQSTLKQNERAAKVNKVDIEEVIAWKDGYFMFDDESLESIMRKVSRWYDVEVVYQDEKLKTQGFGGRVSRFGNVSEVLEILELTELARFKVEGRRIMVNRF